MHARVANLPAAARMHSNGGRRPTPPAAARPSARAGLAATDPWVSPGWDVMAGSPDPGTDRGLPSRGRRSQTPRRAPRTSRGAACPSITTAGGGLGRRPDLARRVYNNNRRRVVFSACPPLVCYAFVAFVRSFVTIKGRRESIVDRFDEARRACCCACCCAAAAALLLLLLRLLLRLLLERRK